MPVEVCFEQGNTHTARRGHKRAPSSLHVIVHVKVSKQELPHPPVLWVETPAVLSGSFPGTSASFSEEGYRDQMSTLGRIPERHSHHL